MWNRRMALASALCLCALIQPGVSQAHHGWAWTTGKDIELKGVIKAIRLGNPHGVVDLVVDGVTWQVEVGQPWRNARAGLKDGDLGAGVELRVVGEPSAKADEKRLKAEKLFIGTSSYNLYPDRD